MTESCIWTYDDLMDYWSTTCDHDWCLEGGGPNDQSMKFCPFCGKPLIESVPVKELEDDDE